MLPQQPALASKVPSHSCFFLAQPGSAALTRAVEPRAVASSTDTLLTLVPMQQLQGEATRQAVQIAALS